MYTSAVQVQPMLYTLLLLIAASTAASPPEKPEIGSRAHRSNYNFRTVSRVRFLYSTLNIAPSSSSEGEVRTVSCGDVIPGSKFNFVFSSSKYYVLSHSPSTEVKQSDLPAYISCAMYSEADPSVNLVRRILVNDMPEDSPEIMKFEIWMHSTTTLRCEKNSTDDFYEWFKYSDKADRFKVIPNENTRYISMSFSSLEINNQGGFTYYKCVAKNSQTGDADEQQIVRLQQHWYYKGDKVVEVSMRFLRSEMSAVPFTMRSGVSVRLICSKYSRDATIQWQYRPIGSDDLGDYQNLTESDARFRIDSSADDQSVLEVKDPSADYEGYYHCIVNENNSPISDKYATLLLGTVE